MVGSRLRSGGDRSVGGGDPLPNDGLPVADESMTDDECRVFDELVERMPVGSLRRIDSYQLCGLSRLICRDRFVSEALREDPLNLQLARLQVSIVNQIGRLSAQFGLSPADRSRMAITPEPDDDGVFTSIMDRMSRG